MPFDYALDSLAQRWHVPPWVVEEGPIEWVLRGLEFQSIEAKVTVQREH